MVLIIFVNDFELTTEKKDEYGDVMIGFSAAALILVTIWMIWQFLRFLYGFKFVRDIIQETKVANKIHPDDDNLKIELEREYNQDEMISHVSGLSASRDDDDQENIEDETIVGIENQYDTVIHYDEKPQMMATSKAQGKNKRQQISDKSSDSGQQLRLMSSRNSSRMLFADINIEEIQ